MAPNYRMTLQSCPTELEFHRATPLSIATMTGDGLHHELLLVLLSDGQWRYEEQIGVDRVLGNSWVILDQSVMIRLRLLLTCYLDECVLLRYPLVHPIR